MPELPEVETVRRGLEKLLPDRRIVRVDVHETRLRYPIDPASLIEACVGSRIVALTRRAKYLLVHLVEERAPAERRLIIHLGMSGRLKVLRPDDPLEPHTHVVFGLDDGRELRFRDHRRFGMVDVVDAASLSDDPRFSHLGVEPLSGDCTAEYFFDRSRRLKKPVKNFLMDSAKVVGVGNIYACEALWVAGVHPARAAGRIGRARWERITDAVKNVLREAIVQGGTTLNDFQNADGTAGYFQQSLRAYGREGEVCERCGGTVKRRVMAGRSTFYCGGCQR